MRYLLLCLGLLSAPSVVRAEVAPCPAGCVCTGRTISCITDLAANNARKSPLAKGRKVTVAPPAPANAKGVKSGGLDTGWTGIGHDVDIR